MENGEAIESTCDERGTVQSKEQISLVCDDDGWPEDHYHTCSVAVSVSTTVSAGGIVLLDCPSFHPCMHPRSWWTRYFINHMGDFINHLGKYHQRVYSFGALEDRYKLVGNEVERLNVKVITRAEAYSSHIFEVNWWETCQLLYVAVKWDVVFAQNNHIEHVGRPVFLIQLKTEVCYQFVLTNYCTALNSVLCFCCQLSTHKFAHASCYVIFGSLDHNVGINKFCRNEYIRFFSKMLVHK